MVKLWDLRKLKNFKTLTLDDRYEVTARVLRDVTDSAQVKNLCFDHSGTYLAVAGTDVR